MNTKKKLFVIVICVFLLIITSVFSTIAYFNASDEYTNTFTVGDVAISLDEAKVNEYGKPLDSDGNVVPNVKDAERIFGNHYKLVPGKTYVKDPTITVLSGSKDSYVRMLVYIEDIDALKQTFSKDKEINGVKVYEDFYDEDTILFHKIVDGYDESKWLYEGFYKLDSDPRYIYEYRYYKKVNGEDGDLVLEPLFTSLTIPSNLIHSELVNLDKFTLDVEGDAIQSVGFENDDEAWESFK